MFRCFAEYYTDVEPITGIQLRAFTKRSALRKALKKIDYVKKLNLGSVRFMQVWFKGIKIYGNGNKNFINKKGVN